MRINEGPACNGPCEMTLWQDKILFPLVIPNSGDKAEMCVVFVKDVSTVDRGQQRVLKVCPAHREWMLVQWAKDKQDELDFLKAYEAHVDRTEEL